MPKEKPLRCMDDLRHAEYYGMQSVFDALYAKSNSGENFTNLMDLILKRENILLAYRNIKTNTGSNTAGTDNLTIENIGGLSPEDVVEKVRFIVAGSKHGYRPKPVRRKDIPKPYDPTRTRPLGIPCIWDRLIQQCIKQVLEPICEAKFSDNSYGFRPNRCAEQAIAKTYKLMQMSHLHYIIEVDIKGFFDNVNHSKLIQQIWAMGIRDKHLIYIIRCILKAPIKMPDGAIIHPAAGTPQGGIISPLLANIVLNELDQWVESQWQHHPLTTKFYYGTNRNGSLNCGYGYSVMGKTNLKKMFIVRYADDFRIFCQTQTDAERTKIAVTQWLKERLKLEVSEEKTRIVNVRNRYSEFLGFKIKVQPRGGKQVVKSHISDKQFTRQKKALVNQAKFIAKPRRNRTEIDEVKRYNAMVMGMQNYYCIATCISKDCRQINRQVMTVLTNRLGLQIGSRLRKQGRKLTKTEQERYGGSRMLRYIAGTGEPIYPVGYARFRNPMAKKRSICSYSPEGRKGLHDNLQINTGLMLKLMRQPLYGESAEYADNRISLFSAQWGRCAITGKAFLTTADIHCHHKVPRWKGGTDKYDNLVLLLPEVHRLIHAKNPERVIHYLQTLNLSFAQLEMVNKFRQMIGLDVIA